MESFASISPACATADCDVPIPAATERLREAQLAPCYEFSEPLSAAKRRFDEFGELGVPLAALVDDLVEVTSDR